MVERIVFDAVLFCCGDILRKGIELAFQRSAMLGEDIEQRRQGGRSTRERARSVYPEKSLSDNNS